MRANLSANYALGADIVDASQTADRNSGSGFVPIGNQSANFKGVFEGLGHNITGLKINRSTDYQIGLFGTVQNAVIRNINLKDIYISGRGAVGGLVGFGQNSLIENSHTSGNIHGNRDVGGLVGYFINGNIIDSSSTANISPLGPNTGYDMGGLVGTFKNGEIKNSFAKSEISGTSDVGGLIGWGVNASINSSYAVTKMSSDNIGASHFGGLLG